MRTLSIFLIGVISFFPAIVQPNGSTVVPSSSPIISKDTVFSFYKSLKKLNPYPIYISSYLELELSICTFRKINLCANSKEIRYQEERERAGPHQDTVVDLYVNTLAESAISQKLATFPTGAVTVLVVRAEHKSLSPFELEPTVVISPSSIYAMLKRAPGFDPQNGDWEYFYAGTSREFAETGGFAKGGLKSCIACHAKAKDADYVFKVRNPEKALHSEIFSFQNYDLLKILHREIYGLQILDNLDREEASPQPK